jgi:hypothetical protein
MEYVEGANDPDAAAPGARPQLASRPASLIARLAAALRGPFRGQ